MLYMAPRLRSSFLSVKQHIMKTFCPKNNLLGVSIQECGSVCKGNTVSAFKSFGAVLMLQKCCLAITVDSKNKRKL